PGFDVIDGKIVNLRGGVYGISDSPFVDFSSLNPDDSDAASWPGSNTFNALFLLTKPSINAPGTLSHIQGSMRVERVSEPDSIALILVGLLGLALLRSSAERSG